jgi:hypothetical protein
MRSMCLDLNRIVAGKITLKVAQEFVHVHHLEGSGSGFRVQGSGFRVQGSGFRVEV